MALKTSLCHVATILAQLVTMTTGSEFYCHGTCYKGAFVPEEHVRKDQALLGHSYRNLSDLTDQECFSACISDCRCLSFQTQDSRCELVEEDRMTAAQDFGELPGTLTTTSFRNLCNRYVNLQFLVFKSELAFVLRVLLSLFKMGIANA